jgi:hypothetical protein
MCFIYKALAREKETKPLTMYKVYRINKIHNDPPVISSPHFWYAQNGEISKIGEYQSSDIITENDIREGERLYISGFHCIAKLEDAVMYAKANFTMYHVRLGIFEIEVHDDNLASHGAVSIWSYDEHKYVELKSYVYSKIKFTSLNPKVVVEEEPVCA